MEFETSIEIDAPAERVYAIIADVERWQEWTASIKDIKLLDGTFQVGSRAKVRQPKLPTATWTVTSLEPGRGFTWEAGGPGFHSVGEHYVTELAPGRCTARLGVRSTGFLAKLFGGRIRRITTKYVRMEAEGLKARAESGGLQLSELST